MQGREGGEVMRQGDVGNAAEALAYVVDCTLATVCDMAMKKSRPKHKYARQKSIAQKGIAWLVEFGCEYHSTRVAEVMANPHFGSVDSWAAQLETP